jgi:HTH-type transcriptional regulator/antitoxin HipB
VDPPGPQPVNRGLGDRFDRPRPRGWYAQRPVRDARSAPRQADHPTPQQQREREAEQQRRPPRRRSRPRDVSACECGVECLLGPGCLPACDCQCEPARAATPHTVTP